MAKKKEFKTIKQRAKEFVDKIDFKFEDQYHWRRREELTDEQIIQVMRVLSKFLTIPTHILNEEEQQMFDDVLFEKINMTNKEQKQE